MAETCCSQAIKLCVTVLGIVHQLHLCIKQRLIIQHHQGIPDPADKPTARKLPLFYVTRCIFAPARCWNLSHKKNSHPHFLVPSTPFWYYSLTYTYVSQANAHSPLS